ncbi:helix-turn-helix domain-containing protein [Planococcus sp. S3-L1]|uniref:helix-turn-helix domain-containing protein n=1 Tax=Planococcus sp. S3-L1 TaxID=3046200 RepID=UPI0024BBA10D|nr:helix-turn-helix domain-containing protein [Planococcus sp. S3-L1]MDJ0331557.1 helix-turn-helix domain-containing protein [Planococcus sp. S3-L1]
MDNSIATLYNRMGFKLPYSVWKKTGESSTLEAIVNKSEMKPPAMENMRGTPIHTFQENDEQKVQFTYADDYHVFLVFTENRVVGEDELAVLFDFFYKGYAQFIDVTGRVKLAKIVDSIRYTTASLNLEDVFCNILTHTLEVITNADYGTLWLYDETKKKIVCKASQGYRYEEIRHMEFELGEGPVGHAFEVGTPVLITNPSDLKFGEVKHISKENKQRWGRRVEDITNIRSVIAYPIVVEDRIECVMYLGQMHSEHVLTDRDLWLLQIFTTQVGIAIRNAKQFANIRELNDALVQRDVIHARLTDLSVRNMGTEKMVEELSQMAGQSLVFIDLLMNEMIPAMAILPTGLSFSHLLQIIQKESQAKSIELNTKEGDVVYPIRSGSVVLGCLIAKSPQTLTRLGEVALEQGSAVLALERVQKQNVLAFYYKNQQQLFDELLYTNDPELLNEKAEALGIRNSEGFVVAMLQVTGCSDPQELEAHIFRLIAELRSAAGALVQTVFGWQNKVILLAGVTGTVELGFFERQLDEMLVYRADGRNDYVLHGGIGSLISSYSDIERSYREAEIALTNPLAGKVNHKLVRYTDIGISRLFTSRNTEEVSKFLSDVFQPLREIDRSGGMLEQTLLVYFEKNRSAGEAAETLHIHINTLYQRLKKIEEVLGLSLKNADDVLQLQLACYLCQRA